VCGGAGLREVNALASDATTGRLDYELWECGRQDAKTVAARELDQRGLLSVTS
jgi:hypothetical protein